MSKKQKRKHHFLRGKRKGEFHGFESKQLVRVAIGHTFTGWCGKVECFDDGLVWVHLNKPPLGVGKVDGRLFYGLPPHMLVRLQS